MRTRREGSGDWGFPFAYGAFVITSESKLLLCAIEQQEMRRQGKSEDEDDQTSRGHKRRTRRLKVTLIQVPSGPSIGRRTCERPRIMSARCCNAQAAFTPVCGVHFGLIRCVKSRRSESPTTTLLFRLYRRSAPTATNHTVKTVVVLSSNWPSFR